MSKIVDEIYKRKIIRAYKIIDCRLYQYKIIVDEDSEDYLFSEYFFGDTYNSDEYILNIVNPRLNSNVKYVEDWYNENIVGNLKKEDLPKEVINKYFN